MKLGMIAVLGLVLTGAACTAPHPADDQMMLLPTMGWDHRAEGNDWTRATLAALRDEGAVLLQTEPDDISRFCPQYAEATEPERAAFWAGLLSALAKYESGWNPAAQGGGGRWQGLMQIAPKTADYYDCDAQTASGLRDGASNLQCAVKIAAVQVQRDGAVVQDDAGRWAGVARDWMPMRDAAKRAEIAAWTSAQPYCAVKTASR